MSKDVRLFIVLGLKLFFKLPIYSNSSIARSVV